MASIHWTVIDENRISGQDIGVAWNAPGTIAVSHNNLLLHGIGIYNLRPGSAEGENNYRGRSSGPLGMGGNGCATVRTWATKPFSPTVKP